MPTDLHQPAAAALDDGLPAPVAVDPDERERLLGLARAAVAVSARAADADELDRAFERARGLDRCAAAFVTLTEQGELRGCMGSLDASRPVAESVLGAATSAARRDPRFRPVLPAELPNIEIEVSVLGPLAVLRDPERFRLGIDGIIVERGAYRGLLLPEVAGMLSWDRTEMLDTTCRKAGLPRGAWRAPGTIVYAFRTDRFGGPAVCPTADRSAGDTERDRAD